MSNVSDLDVDQILEVLRARGYEIKLKSEKKGGVILEEQFFGGWRSLRVKKRNGRSGFLTSWWRWGRFRRSV